MKSTKDTYVSLHRLDDASLQLEEKKKQLEIINDFVIELFGKVTIDEIVWSIAKKVIARLGFVDCVVYLYDETEDVMVQVAAHGAKNPLEFDIKNPIKISIGEGIVGSVAESQKGEIVSDTRLDPRYVVDDDNRLSEIAVPIYYENKIIGVIDSEHPKIDFYTQDHLQLLKSIAAISATKIMHAKAMVEIQEYQKNLEFEVAKKTQELQNTISKLKKSNEDLESFAYAASHDLQEPIRTIASYLQLIKKREKCLSIESEEFIDFAVDGSIRMRKLLEGLLAYSKLKKVDEGFEVINMNDIVEIIKANLYTQIKETQADIRYNDLGMIEGDRTQILQLFQNLVSNAIKFRKKEESPKIEISVIKKPDRRVFKIKDQGIGIEPSFYRKIFNLFSRLNTIDKFRGSGIGLALCKKIVGNHNGEINLRSEIDKGTTFFISLPIIRSSSK